MIKDLTEKVALNNGTGIPGLGLGVFQIPNSETAEVVAKGIQAGYRLIDTAQVYGNEAGVGEGIKAGLAATGLKRSDLFITSKIWNDHLDYEAALAAVDSSLELLGLDYLDLYLIHWPGQDGFKEAYQALETRYKEGKIKAIGVSNFTTDNLEELAQFATVAPVLNQVETHPMNDQKEMLAYAAAHDMRVQAWSPLMQGQILDNALLKTIADKHDKTVAQVVLRWHIQRGVLVVAKSVHEERMRSNAAIFDFILDEDDMALIDGLNADRRVGPDPASYNFEL